jgi:hypothetical protein
MSVPILFLLIALNVAFPLRAEPVQTFNEAPSWRFDCAFNALSRAAGWCVNPTDESGCTQAATIIWNRDRAEARFLWPNGNGKGLREIEGFAGRQQGSAHFWFSPATSRQISPGAKASKFGGGVEAFGPTFVSVRITGEAAMTTHDIIYGGMKALSHEGECAVIPILAEGE